MGRAAALLALFSALVAWYELAPHLEPLSRWPSVLVTAAVVMPAVLALSWLAVPLLRRARLVPLTLLAAALAIGLSQLDAPVAANFAKYAAITSIGWLFLMIFEALSWVVMVALIIPLVDTFSVYKGPTKAITTHHPEVYTAFSVAFVSPGGGAARLGFPDIMFFALFLAATVRFDLRTGATWICMAAALGLTLVLTTFTSTSGLPALPAISLGFLLANGDLLWRRIARRSQPAAGVSEG